jgi:hypothetical protein
MEQQLLQQIVDRQAARARAAAELLRLAEEVPDLLIEVADAIRGTASMPAKAAIASTTVLRDGRRKRPTDVSHLNLVIDYLESRNGESVSTAEIAEATDIDPGSVRTILYDSKFRSHFEIDPELSTRNKKYWRLGRNGFAHEADDQHSGQKKVGATEAIMDWLAEHPQGGTTRVIVNDIVDRVKTDGTPGKVIGTTLSQLASRGRVYFHDSDEGGRTYYVPEIKINESTGQ